MLPLADPALAPEVPAAAVAYPSRDPNLEPADGFANPPQGYGEVPFWWWTGDPLDKKRLEWQIEKLHENGVSGMQVNYAHRDTKGWPTFPNTPEIFTDSWWACYSHASEIAAKYNMGIGLSTYTLDWTKGDNLFNRIVYNDPAFHARQLRGACVARLEPGKTVQISPRQNSIGFWKYPTDSKQSAKPGEAVENHADAGPVEISSNSSVEVWEFWYETQEGTLNPVHPQSGQRVIDKFFQPFEDHNPGKTSAGLNYFFNDELRLGTGDRGWCDDFPQEFLKYKGYDLFGFAPALFTDWGNITGKVRMDYADVLMHLTEQRYFKPIYVWHASRGMTYGCDNNGRGLSPTEYGDYFRAIRWYSAPGHDTPGGCADFIKGKVSSSIANLYQRPRVWLEGYHSLGWGANPNGLMYATNENYVYGCTLLNLHGLYYTTHGSAWEWAPPCYHFRMPYWKHLGTFLKYFERLSYLMSQGVWQSEIAIMYPTSPGAAGLDANQQEATKVAFEAAQKIYASGRDITFIDDQSVLRATIEKGTAGTTANGNKSDGLPRLCVSGMKFAVYGLPSVKAIRGAMLVKRREFQKAGGIVVCIGKRPCVSDRTGANDPELNRLVEQMFPNTETFDGQKKLDGQKGLDGQKDANALAKANESVEPRRYPGGFTGYWAWTQETNLKTITAEGVLSGLTDAPQNWQVRFACDNHGDLYVNEKRLCQNVDYSTGWTGAVSLKNGDRIRIEGRDDDNGDHTAGVFLAVSDGQKTVFSTLDLKYQRGKDWIVLDATNTHNLHRFGQNNAPGMDQNRYSTRDWAGIWKPLVERLPAFPQDVKGPSGIKYLHRRIGFRDVYLVMGVEREAKVAFRSLGQAERWDAMSGKRFPLDVESVEDGYSTVVMPLDANQATLVVFDSRTKAAVSAGKPARVERSEPQSQTLDGSWEFELIPTMDNRWGDFQLPVTDDNRTIGAQARRFRYAEGLTADQALAAVNPGFDDSQWETVTYGFGQKFWLTKTRLSDDVSPSAASAIGASPQRKPYCFSWRSGIEGNPGHQGWHGLKENISDAFIGLGTTKSGHNEDLYVDETPPQRYWLTTTVCGQGAATIQRGGNLPDRVYLDGQPLKADQTTVVLSGRPQTLVLSYPKAGRGYWLLQKGECAPIPPQVEAAEIPAGQSTRSTIADPTPLAMTWYDIDRIEFNPGTSISHPHTNSPNADSSKGAVYRFTAPAGLKRLILTTDPAVPEFDVYVNGTKRSVRATAAVQKQTARWESILNAPELKPAVVAIVLRNDNVSLPRPWRGEFFAEPVRLETTSGLIEKLSDWSQDGTVLANYSGGAVYRKTIRVSQEEADSKSIQLDLGPELGATAEVRVNGLSAGILVAAPWIVNLTDMLKVGENRLEIEVYNTLANHYSTIPTRYKGPSSKSGLIGPVRIIRGVPFL